MKLFVVLTCLNDPDLPNTIQSLRETASSKLEIIVMDDAPNGNRNYHRCGVGPCRYMGTLLAKGDYVLLLDSHMRFLPGWYDKVIARLESHPETLYCFCCLGLDRDHMDPVNPVSRYYGATWNLFGHDPNKPEKIQVLEPNWLKQPPEDDAEIPCVLGGAYAASREWMLRLTSGLVHLRQWAEDETVLSLRSWLLGGDCRIMTSVGIGHRFLKVGEQQPYKVDVGNPMHNKLFVLHTLLPADLRDWLLDKLQSTQGGGELSTGWKLLKANWHLLEAERTRNQVEFVRDFGWVAKKFGIALPVMRA